MITVSQPISTHLFIGYAAEHSGKEAAFMIVSDRLKGLGYPECIFRLRVSSSSMKALAKVLDICLKFL